MKFIYENIPLFYSIQWPAFMHIINRNGKFGTERKNQIKKFIKYVIVSFRLLLCCLFANDIQIQIKRKTGQNEKSDIVNRCKGMFQLLVLAARHLLLSL